MKFPSLVLAAAFLTAVPAATDAQLSFGAHVAHATDVFDGTTGIGASAAVDVPLFPVGALFAGDYFFPDCGSVEGCSFMGGSASLVVRLPLPLPLIRPYATGGVVYRRYGVSDAIEATSNTGYGAGVGIDLSALLLRAYLEARYEWVDPDDQLVVRLGLLF